MATVRGVIEWWLRPFGMMWPMRRQSAYSTKRELNTARIVRFAIALPVGVLVLVLIN